MRNYKRHEFTAAELSHKAFDVYSNSTYEFWERKFADDGIYYLIDCDRVEKMGTVDDVNEWFESIADEDEEEDD